MRSRTAANSDAAPSACPPLLYSVAIALLVGATFAFRLSATQADADLWGHIKFGQDFWRVGHPVRADDYSYLSGERPWVNHEWLAEAVMALAWDRGGAPGLIALKVALGLALILAIATHLRARGIATLPSSLLASYAMVLILPGFGSVRPHLWTYLAFACVLAIVDRADRGSPAWLWAAVPVCALWANLHGGMLAGIGIALIWAAAHIAFVRGRRWRETVRVVPPVVAMILATLINPYGATLWTFLLDTAIGSRPDIAEWQPVKLTTIEGATFAAALAIFVMALTTSRRPRSPVMLVVFAATAVLPFVARRHIALFAIAGVMVAGEHVADAAHRLVAHGWPRGLERGRDRHRAIAGVLLAETLVLAALAVPRFRQIEVDVMTFPVDAVRLLKASGASGHLAVWFDWGEHALWHLGPRVLVSIDGRRETVYTEQVRRDNSMFADGTGEWDRLLRRARTDLALVPTGSPPSNLLRLEPSWRLLYEDRVAMLFAREDWPSLPAITAARAARIDAPAPATFP